MKSFLGTITICGLAWSFYFSCRAAAVDNYFALFLLANIVTHCAVGFFIFLLLYPPKRRNPLKSAYTPMARYSQSP